MAACLEISSGKHLHHPAAVLLHQVADPHLQIIQGPIRLHQATAAVHPVHHRHLRAVQEVVFPGRKEDSDYLILPTGLCENI